MKKDNINDNQDNLFFKVIDEDPIEVEVQPDNDLLDTEENQDDSIAAQQEIVNISNDEIDSEPTLQDTQIIKTTEVENIADSQESQFEEDKTAEESSNNESEAIEKTESFENIETTDVEVENIFTKQMQVENEESNAENVELTDESLVINEILENNEISEDIKGIEDNSEPVSTVENQQENIADEVLPVAVKKGKKDKTAKVTKTKEHKSKKETVPQSEKKKKQKKILIITVAVLVLIAIITVSIVVPIVVINKDKIFVSKAEDFANVDKGNYYVLKNDIVVDGDLTITNPYSIDLGKYTLEVKGALTFNHNSSDKTIFIGKKDGKEYVNGGRIQADKIVFGCSGKVSVFSPLEAKEINITNASVTMFSAIMAENIINIEGGEQQFNDTVNFGESGIINIKDSKVSLNNGAIADIFAANSEILLAKNRIKSINLDESGTFKCYGNVEGTISGGKLVLMGKGSSAKVIENALELWMTRDNLNIDEIRIIEGNIRYIEQLETPGDITVVSKIDSKYEDGITYTQGIVECIVGKVNYATRYAFYINDNEPIIVAADGNPEGAVICDITAYVTQAGMHNIKVVAMGSEGMEELVLSSDPIYYNYEHSVKLETPSDLKVYDKGDGTIELSFNKVSFADQYKVIINGVERIFNDDVSLKDKMIIDITEQINVAGAYSIRVQALCAKNPSVKASDMAMTSFELRGKYDAPTLSVVKSSDGLTATISWAKVHNAQRYTVQFTDSNGEHEVNIAKTEFTIVLADFPGEITIKVKANGYKYYSDSDFSYITIK